MAEQHESRISKLEQRADHAEQDIRALGPLVQDHGAHRERLEGLGRDVDRLGEKVRNEAGRHDRERDDLERELRAEIKDIGDEIKEFRRERKSDRINRTTVFIALGGLGVMLAGLIFTILTFAGAS